MKTTPKTFEMTDKNIELLKQKKDELKSNGFTFKKWFNDLIKSVLENNK